MSNIAALAGIQTLWSKTLGDPQICVAVLDGLVDQAHPCFEGADLTRLPTLLEGEADPHDAMSVHGTHVTSVIFGQTGSPVQGIAPRCKGLIIPIFSDAGRLSQLDLSRAIEQAVIAGANLINISGGQLTDFGEAESWLERAANLCKESNVLIVAAAGNDGCDCVHVPAALPAILAVGAMNAQGQPLDASNWGEPYQTQGVLAVGENILGATPGGGTVALSGSSFATPIVTGVAALLLSMQRERGDEPNSKAVRAAILKSVVPCYSGAAHESRRCLVGRLNIPGALHLTVGETMNEQLGSVAAAGCDCGGTDVAAKTTPHSPETTATGPISTDVVSGTTPSVNLSKPNKSAQAITASQPPNAATARQEGGLVYVLGTLGYDFGSEARRDSFKQLMPAVEAQGVTVPANPYDARQMVDYLARTLSEAKALIWTLNLELTPIYAIEPLGPFAREIYGVLQELLDGQIQAEDHEHYVERVSIPGRLTGRTVRLFSGQTVPLVETHNTRGLYGWKVNTLVQAAQDTMQAPSEGETGAIRRSLQAFLTRIYYDLRNLGTTSQDRALNFAATNAFQAASAFAQAVAVGMELDSIVVEKSPFCRMDSDCWDVKLKFFDPENSRRARKVYRFTIDVSDVLPVTLGEVRVWSTPD